MPRDKNKLPDPAVQGAELRPDRLPSENARRDVAAFLEKARALQARADLSGVQRSGPPGQATRRRGRLMFALDATMSRQPTWDLACQLQGEMFAEAGKLGGLDVQLMYFRGFNECRASTWVSDTAELGRLMGGIDCRGGRTQIERVLRHARRETQNTPVQAVVYVGDAMEESIDTLCDLAGELGLLGVPLFLFQEGHDPDARRAFQEMARLSGGAFSSFDPGAADQLRELLSAVAAFAAGGQAGLRQHLIGNRAGNRASGGRARLLLEQLSGGKS